MYYIHIVYVLCTDAMLVKFGISLSFMIVRLVFLVTPLSLFSGDECHTERELPPLIIASDFKCKNFSFGGRYFHLHGGK